MSLFSRVLAASRRPVGIAALFVALVISARGQAPAPLADINVGTGNSTPQCFVVLSNKLYFTAIPTGGTQRQLYSYDPTLPIGSQVVKVSNFAPPTATTTHPSWLRVLAGKIVMVAQSTSNGPELHEYDPGTGTITEMALNGTLTTQPRNLLVHEGKLYFQGHNGDRPLSWSATIGGSPVAGGRGTQVYVYDPALPKKPLSDPNPNPKVLTDLNPNNVFGCSPANLVGLPGKVFFSAQVAYADNQWGTQGGGRIGGGYYTGDDEEMVMLDTTAQTNVILQIAQGSFTGTFNGVQYTDQLDSHPLAFSVVVSNVLYFSASPTDSPHGSANYRGQALMKFDPATMAAPVKVLELSTDAGQVGSTEPAGDNIQSMAAIGGIVYYSGTDGGTNYGQELYYYDTVAGSGGIATNILTGTTSSSPSGLTAFNGKLYFSATGPASHGSELWEYNPAAPSAREVADINTGATGSSPAGFFPFDGKLFFRATGPSIGSELYYYDPNADKVTLTADTFAGASSGASSFNNVVVLNAAYPTAAAFNNNLFFPGNNGTTSPGVGAEPFFLAATATISNSVSGVMENGGAVTWTVRRNGTAVNAATISFSVGGTATLGSDYTQSGAATFSASNGTVTMGINVSNVTFTTTPIADSDTGEADETIIITLTNIVTSVSTNTLNTSATLVITNITAPPNSAPVIAAGNASLSVGEGNTATNTGTYSDADGDTVAITASLGAITRTGTSNGNWNWSYTPPDGLLTNIVTVTAADSHGASNVTTFTMIISNLAPVIALTGSSPVNQGASFILNLGAITDPGTDTVTGYSIEWGDGTTNNFAGIPAGSQAHTYATPGVKNISVSLTDEDGTFPGAGTASVTVNALPMLTLPPSPVLAEATGPGGANVNFSVTANDAEDGALIPAVMPPSGSLFALGDTIVTAIATDSNGASVTNTFVVRVGDTTMPSITIPGDLTTAATSAAGAVVNFSVTATDIVDGAISPLVTPASGSTFAIGTNTVNVSAQDSHGNVSSASFLVVVVSAPEIGVEQPAGIDLVSGGATNDFGSTTIGSSNVLTFTITNSGVADLAGLMVTVDGANSNEFAIIVAPVASVSSGSNTIFSVAFAPAAAGQRTAALHVASNDQDENPFDIFLAGVGNTAPTLTVPPSPVVAEATGPGGAVVNFSVTANDAEDGALTPSVNPASGSLFAVGITLVTAIATDSFGASVTNTFNVKVEDTIPPQISVPADITVTATSPAGAVVTFSVSATDIVDGAVSPMALPASGSTFARGSNNVAVSAIDAHGNSSSTSFNVFVLNAAPVLGALSDYTVNPGAIINFTATATDADGDGMSFSLLNPPANASINAAGAFTWRPHLDQADTTNTVTVIVIDDFATQARSATNSFTVIVNPLAPVVLTSIGMNTNNGHYLFTVDGTTGPDYVIETTTEFPLVGPATWTPMSTNASPTTPFLLDDATASYDTNRFYRVRLQP